MVKPPARPSARDAELEHAFRLMSAGDMTRAEETARAIAAAERRNVRAINLIGAICARTRRTQEAAEFYRRSLRIDRDQPAIQNMLGNALIVLGALEDAVPHFDHAIALRPEFAAAHANRGAALLQLNRPEDARESYERALALKPDYAEGHLGHGSALSALARYDEAIAAYERATAFDPELWEAHTYRGHMLLMRGQYAEGWRGYEYRLRTKPDAQHTSKRWRAGMPLAGETILLHTEQGFGDTIQFARFAPLIAARGARVILQVQQPLVALLATVSPDIEVIAAGETAPAHTLHCPLLSLPLELGVTLETLANAPYLHADAARVAAWAERLGPYDGRLRVGLVWSGNPAFVSDRARSASVEIIRPLFEEPCAFHCLQKDIRDGDRAALAALPMLRVHADDLHDFRDTAALASHMDVVITTCTSVAHLAGALGLPTWLMLAHAADFRWMTGREDSPWYPTARLFRQPTRGDWKSVIGALRSALRTRMAG